MKKILAISLLMISTAIYSQSISDYQYIYIPKEFADAKANKYGLKEALKNKLKAKKYVIIENQNVLNCEILKAEVADTSNFMKNKVQISFKDCNDKIIASYEGKSSIKEFEPGMKEALQFAMNNVGVSAPKSSGIAVLKEKSEPISEKIAENKEENSTTKNEILSENKAESFSNGTLNLNKITISHNQFILANPSNSVPFAIFKASTKKDVYHVQLENGSHTLGYFENGKIVIEIPTSDGNYRKEEFLKK